MDELDRLRQAIDKQLESLRQSVPSDRGAAVAAVVRAIDRQPNPLDTTHIPDVISFRRLADAGGNMALRLCLEAGGTGSTPADLDAWAAKFVADCGHVAEAEMVLMHVESGFMRLAADGSERFDAWIATKLTPVNWVERADYDWWAAWLRRQHRPGVSERPADEASSRRMAEQLVDAMAYQFGYPLEATLDGSPIRLYRDVLRWLIAYAFRAEQNGEAVVPIDERTLLTAMAASLLAGPAVLGKVLAGFTLDAENAAYHASVAGVAPAPLVRLDDGRLLVSTYGLTTEPLLFLTRELRRRAAEDYHNTAHVREDVFRQDLYALFPARRFVTSTGRIELRRESGNVRTDIDAVVFDRKTGTLGFFELKSQDPFARSVAERGRQRDNLLYANRQVSGVLAWLQRSGGDALLNRVDNRTAKQFRVQKVFPFVLGRYLAHFNDGPEPDRRAAWGTWPQVLRLLDGKPFGANDANPLATLHNRLSKDQPLARRPLELETRRLDLGPVSLTVYPSFAAYGEASRSR